jgi:hypothetical protein
MKAAAEPVRNFSYSTFQRATVFVVFARLDRAIQYSRDLVA